MRTDLFDFELPAERIALRPASPRDAARLLVVRPGGQPETEGRVVRDLPDLLRPGDQLVVNDTKVIPAALHGRRLGRATEPKIEATLIGGSTARAGARWSSRRGSVDTATWSASARRARSASSASSTRRSSRRASAAR